MASHWTIRSAVLAAVFVGSLALAVTEQEFGCGDRLAQEAQVHRDAAAARAALVIAELRRNGLDLRGRAQITNADLVRWYRWWSTHPIVSPVIGHEYVNAAFGRAAGPVHALALHATREGIAPSHIRKIWRHRPDASVPWEAAIAFLVIGGRWQVLDPRDPDTAYDVEGWWEQHRGEVREGTTTEVLLSDAHTIYPTTAHPPGFADLLRDSNDYETDPLLIARRNQHLFASLAQRLVPFATLNRRATLRVSEAKELAKWLAEHPIASENGLARAGLGLGSCHLQAFAAALRAEMLGLEPRSIAKVWAYGSFRTQPTFDWGFHVATAVRTDEGWYLVDTSSGAMRLDDWGSWLRSSDPFGVRRFKVTDALAFDTFGSQLFATGYEAYRSQFFDPLVRELLMEDLAMHDAENREQLLARYPALAPAFNR